MPQTNAASLANLEKRARGRTSPNKYTSTIKEMVEHALHNAGGVEYLTKQAHANPVAFMGLVGRVLPLQLSAGNGTSLDAQHLIAASAMGLELVRIASEHQQQPTNGRAVTIETTATEIDLDAPPPEE